MERVDVSDVAGFGEEYEKHGLFETPRMFGDVYCFEPGQSQDVHAHDDGDKVYYVLDGELVATVGDEEQRLSAGEATMAPAGEPHGVRNETDARARALVFMARDADAGHASGAGGHGHGDAGEGSGHGHDHGQAGHEHQHGHGDHAGHDHGASGPFDVAVVTVSTSREAPDDASGDAIATAVEEAGHAVAGRDVVTDDAAAIRGAVEDAAARADAVVTTGGTGLTPDDVTPETVRPLFDREIPGFGEYFRRISHEAVGTPAMLSRATAGVADGTPIYLLPGSEDAAALGARRVVLPELGHVVGLARR